MQRKRASGRQGGHTDGREERSERQHAKVSVRKKEKEKGGREEKRARAREDS